MPDINAKSILGALGLQRQESSNYLGPVVGAFFVGGLIGAGIALLFAPKAGGELRRELGQRIDEVLASDEELVSEYKPGASESRKGDLGITSGANPAQRSGF
jgi:hypothetical protein